MAGGEDDVWNNWHLLLLLGKGFSTHQPRQPTHQPADTPGASEGRAARLAPAASSRRISHCLGSALSWSPTPQAASPSKPIICAPDPHKSLSHCYVKSTKTSQSLPSSTSPARDTRLSPSVSLRRHVVSTGIHSLRYGSSRHGTSARFVTCIMTDVHHCPFIQWPKHPLCSACLPLHPTALVNQGSFYCLCGKRKCRRSVVELASLP